MGIPLEQLFTLTGNLDHQATDRVNTPRERFRRYLEVASLDLEEFTQLIIEANHEPTEQHKIASKDLICMFGHYLGFEVSFGDLVVEGDTGIDCLWKSPIGPQIAIKLGFDNSSFGKRQSEAFGGGTNSDSSSNSKNWEMGLYITYDEQSEHSSSVHKNVSKTKYPIRMISIQALITLAEFANGQVCQHSDLLNVFYPFYSNMDPLVASLKRLFDHEADLSSLPEEIVIGGRLYRVIREGEEARIIQTLSGMQDVSQLLRIMDHIQSLQKDD